MTLIEMIAMVDELRPNQISKQTKTTWLNEIEHRVYDEVISRAARFCPWFDFKPYEYEVDDDTELAVPDYYCDVYRTYICSKIDVALGEIDRYNNDAALFEAAWSDYAAWYRRNHMPKERRFKHGPFAIFEPLDIEINADSEPIQGAESESDSTGWRVCRYEKCFRPVLACDRCTKAERHHSLDNDESEGDDS